MTRARMAEESAADERNRAAWNLPRRPLDLETPSPSATIDAGSADVAVEPYLDWNAFRLRSFPQSRRHHLPALAAYAAYKSSRVFPPAARVQTNVARRTSPESAATDSWEDEGGAGWQQPSKGGAS